MGEDHQNRDGGLPPVGHIVPLPNQVSNSNQRRLHIPAGKASWIGASPTVCLDATMQTS